MGWNRTATNAALSVDLLISGLSAYPVGTRIDHGHGRRAMVCGTMLAAAMLVLLSQAHSLVTLFVVWTGLGVAMTATLYDPVFAVITRNSERTKAARWSAEPVYGVLVARSTSRAIVWTSPSLSSPESGATAQRYWRTG